MISIFLWFWQWHFIEVNVKDVIGNIRFIFLSQQGTNSVAVGLDDIDIAQGLCLYTSG